MSSDLSPPENPSRWIRNASGFFIPTSLGEKAPVSGNDQEVIYRRRELRALWVQALSGVIAIVISAAALIISIGSIRDQQQIDQSQRRLNSQSLDVLSRRYASRVASLQAVSGDPKLVPGPAGGPQRKVSPVTVRIQNRSTATLTNVTAFSHAYNVPLTHSNSSDVPSEPPVIELSIGTVPACTDEAVTLSPNDIADALQRVTPNLDWANLPYAALDVAWDTERVLFIDPVGVWEMIYPFTDPVSTTESPITTASIVRSVAGNPPHEAVLVIAEPPIKESQSLANFGVLLPMTTHDLSACGDA